MTKRAALAAGITCLLTTAPLVLPIPSASAGTLRIQDNHPLLVLVYSAPSGERNNVTASVSGTTYTVHDTVGVTAAPGRRQQAGDTGGERCAFRHTTVTLSQFAATVSWESTVAESVPPPQLSESVEVPPLL